MGLTRTFNDLPIGGKLGIMVLALLAFPVLSLVYVSLQVRAANLLIREQQTALERLETIHGISLEGKNLQYWLTDLALSLLNESEAKSKETKARLGELLATFEKANPDEAAAIRADLDGLARKFEAAADAFTDENRVLGNSLTAEARRTAAGLEARLARLLAKESRYAGATGQAVIERNQSVLRLSFLFCALAILLGAAVGILFSRSISRPIRNFESRIREIQETNDLTRRADVDSRDEIGSLARSFNSLIEKLHGVVSRVSRMVHDSSRSAQQIARSTEAMAGSLFKQNLQVSQIAAAIEEMTTSISEVARTIAEAAGSASSAGKNAEDGGAIVGRTIIEIQGIQKAVNSTSTSVKELGERGNRIGQIIQVIDEIADQTNLLALNAAIEAARAGEHGRGFAVVADEVRKLADRTTRSTEEVSQSIQTIQTETAQATEKMAVGIERVGKGVDCAQKAGASLQMIVAGTREVASQIQSIAAAAEKQAATAREISTSINSIGSIQEAADDGARHTKAAIACLIAEGSEVKNLLGQFKIAGGAPSRNSIPTRAAPEADLAKSIETPQSAAAGGSPGVA